MRVFSCLLVLILCGCSTAVRTPEGVLDRDRFSDVLLEVTLLEARMNRELVTEMGASIPMEERYKELFEAKKVTKEEFERSFDHYAAHPELMAAIYDGIITELGRRKDGLRQRASAPAAKADTLATDSSSVLKR